MRTRGFAAIGLCSPKTEANVGGAFRAAQCYDAAMVAVLARRIAPMPTDTMKAARHIPILAVDDLRRVIPHGAVPVAIEIAAGARSLVDYAHPQQAFYIFGPEDGSVPADVMAWCRDVVKVPTAYCMNLAATVNVVLYDRMAKRWRA